jgi:hypothetical protein
MNDVSCHCKSHKILFKVDALTQCDSLKFSEILDTVLRIDDQGGNRRKYDTLQLFAETGR